MGDLFDHLHNAAYKMLSRGCRMDEPQVESGLVADSGRDWRSSLAHQARPVQEERTQDLRAAQAAASTAEHQ